MVPEPSLKRLPSYLHYLQTLEECGTKMVSTSHIASYMKLDPTLVRKDLSYTRVQGRPRTGYVVTELQSAIRHFLGWDNISDAFLVGTGHLGQALLGYERFSSYGISIVAAFDINPDLIGMSFKGVKVLPVSKLTALTERMGIHLGIIATPASTAQYVADQLVKSGVKALLNFAPCTLSCPLEVAVQNVDLYASVALLTSHLKQTFQSA